MISPAASSVSPRIAASGAFTPGASAYCNCLPSFASSGNTSTRSPCARSWWATPITCAGATPIQHSSSSGPTGSAGNIPRSSITTRMRSSPSENPTAGTCFLPNIPTRSS